MGIPAIVTAGDRGAAKSVYGESKVYLEIAGEPLVARIVDVLQRVPEISDVWVIGNAERLELVFGDPQRRACLTKPLHVLAQFRNLFENCWESYRRALPKAGPDGRDPEGADAEFQVLYLSGDLPFATPQEISDFIRRGQATGADYVVGLVPEASLADFLPAPPHGVGIEVAYFNLREGRLRQSNLHLARPAKMGARELIEEMYEHRHQKSFWNMVGLGLRIVLNRGGGLRVAWFYLLLHIGGLLDRFGLRRLADGFRFVNGMRTSERSVGSLLRTAFRFVVTEAGGCAIDIDTEQEYDAVKSRFDEWSNAQAARAEALYGPVAIDEMAGAADSVGEARR